MKKKALTKESQGYCPKCGYWGVSTGEYIGNAVKADVCSVCGAIFPLSDLDWLDSGMCECGHPRSWHDRSNRYCEKGATQGCKCQKYHPTLVEVLEL